MTFAAAGRILDSDMSQTCRSRSQARALAQRAFYVVLPSRHRLARAKEIELKALNDATLMSLPTDSRTRRIIDGAAATAGFSFRHTITMNQFATLYSFVRNGARLTVVPALARPLANDRELRAHRQAVRCERNLLVRLTNAKRQKLCIVRKFQQRIGPA